MFTSPTTFKTNHNTIYFGIDLCLIIKETKGVCV